jgi:ABC-type sulfate/molybdate transport systems ATPase subunit
MTLDFTASARLGSFEYGAAFEARDEIVVLFGHSGAGKSLTLQYVSGLAKPDRGRITINGETVFDSNAGLNLPAQARHVGYVVQDLALFPHMTVAENVGFALPRGLAGRRRVGELLAMLGLEGFGNRRPATLSGGQQQRVALARALARDATVLLLDEPFSALDESLRSSLRRELLRLRKELGLTILFVTHDLREAHLLADRLAVFDDGHVLQFGAREDVFRRPLSRRVAELTGVANILRGRVTGRDADSLVVDVDGLLLRCARQSEERCSAGQPVDIAVRAERVTLRRSPHEEGRIDNRFEGLVVEEFPFGSSHTLHLSPVGPGPDLVCELAARPYEVLGVEARKRWTIELRPEDLHVMTAASPVAADRTAQALAP